MSDLAGQHVAPMTDEDYQRLRQEAQKIDAQIRAADRVREAERRRAREAAEALAEKAQQTELEEASRLTVLPDALRERIFDMAKAYGGRWGDWDDQPDVEEMAEFYTLIANVYEAGLAY